MEISTKNCNLFCRTCLTQLNERKFNIFVQNSISKLLIVCTSLNFEENEKFPDSICELCFNKVHEYYNFREMCLETINKLNNVIEKEKIEFLQDSSLKENDSFDSKLSEFMTDSKNIDIDKELKTTPTIDQHLGENTNENHSEKDDCLDEDSSENSESEDNGSEIVDDDDVQKETNNEIDSKFNLRKTRSNLNTQKQKTSQTYVCDKCPKKCFKKERMDAHMRTHEGLRPFPCTQCDKAYNKTSHLNAHIKDVHNKTVEIIVCEVVGCGKTFKRNQTYRAHCRIKHSERPYEPKIFVCEDCGKTFKNISTLKEHRYKHSGEEYPYKCEQCPKKYISQRTYREHLMRHAGIKNFICPYCGMKKTTKSELRTHINYHTKEKQWHCPSCSQVFNSSANLGLHVRVVHKGIRRYSCKYCDQSFGKAETLKHHEMRHTGEKPHECKICGKRFIQIVAMRAHLKTHNK